MRKNPTRLDLAERFRHRIEGYNAGSSSFSSSLMALSRRRNSSRLCVKRVVEYKQTARWNVREKRRDQRMEQVVVKTVAGLLNDRGGTLLIGVTDSREAVGLEDDYAQVKPPNADGYVNWLDTLFENNLGHVGANRLDIRIDRVSSHDVCCIDVPASSRPIWVKNKKGADVLSSAATTRPDKSRQLKSKPSSPSDSGRTRRAVVSLPVSQKLAS